MNIKLPAVFLRIPTEHQTIVALRPRDICYLEDKLGTTTVVHLVGETVSVFKTQLTTGDIEEALHDLSVQEDEYQIAFMNKQFGENE